MKDEELRAKIEGMNTEGKIKLLEILLESEKLPKDERMDYVIRRLNEEANLQVN